MTAQHRRKPRSRQRSQPKSHGPRREHIEELHPVENIPEIESFDGWDLGDEIQRAIRNMDITVPTPIQALTIGAVLEGRDVIAKAETGTGKTLAFGAPMMARIDPARSTVLGLILCPTRELAQQVSDVIKALALPRGIRVALVVGGDPMQPQVAALQGGAQVVVGTPGRVLDLYQQRFLSFPWTEYAILDEADKMFEIGFLDDIKKILSFMPDERQTLLFSATFPTEVLKLARAETRDPVEVATQRGTATVSTIEQTYLELPSEDRPLTLIRLLEQSAETDTFLVFCERRTDVDRLMRRLERLPFSIKALHGGYDQASRFRVMSAFRTGEVKALVATDVASRGLDVQHVTHVLNFGVPREPEDYTHRIGRTGRAGRTGTAITFVTAEDRGRWRRIVSSTKFPVKELELPGPSRRAGGRRGGRDSAGEARDRGGRDGRREGRGSRDDRPRREEPRRERPAREAPERRADERKPVTQETGDQPFGALPETEARPTRSEQKPERARRRPRRGDRKPATGGSRRGASADRGSGGDGPADPSSFGAGIP